MKVEKRKLKINQQGYSFIENIVKKVGGLEGWKVVKLNTYKKIFVRIETLSVKGSNSIFCSCKARCRSPTHPSLSISQLASNHFTAYIPIEERKVSSI